MTQKQQSAVMKLLRDRRIELGMSARELARRAGIDNATITLLEQDSARRPQVETIRAMAKALDLSLADVFAAADWLPEDVLPSLRPYMRAKYATLPDEAVRRVERYIERLSRQYGTGPTDGEDE